MSDNSRDLNRSIKIFIDGTPAAQGIAPLEAAIQKLEARLASLNKSEKGYEEKSKKLKQQLESKNHTLQNYKKQVEETERVLKNLSGSTYNELIAVQTRVRKQLRDAVPGTEQYTNALEQNRRVAVEVARAQKAMRVEIGCQGTTVGKAIDLFNKYAAIVTTVVAAITGMVLKLNQLRELRNKREEAKADVAALTGLDDASIDWLEQQAKKLSTTVDEQGIRIRQSATEIMDAFKLVGSAKPELLSDKEALAEVTKQPLILASASGMQLKDAVDAVTLSLNQYGDGADKAARYANVMAAGSKYGAAGVESVTTAITKSGVAASSANIPIEQLVGSIETLAEKGIKDEIAGTGLKKFFLTLQTGADETNPKIVGLEAALDALQKKQMSAAQIKKMFGEEGYNVASVLINEAEKVKYYTQAVTDTTVAVEQAATKSATAAAKLDQARNKLNEMGIELVEKLNPAILASVNGVVSWGRKFVELCSFIANHTGALITLTTAVVTYTVATKAATLYETKLKEAKLAHIAVEKLMTTWHKASLAATLSLSAAKYALTGNIKLATQAVKRLNVALKGNLFGIVITAVATVCAGLYQLVNRSSAASDAMRRMNGELLNEQRSLTSLFDTLKRTNPGSEERKRILQEINDRYGQYLPSLLTEKSTLDEINSAYRRINTSITEQIALKYKNEEISEVTNKAAEKQIEAIETVRQSLVKTLGNNNLSNYAIQDLKQITTEFYNAGMSWQKAYSQAYDTIKAKYFGGKSISKLAHADMIDYIKSYYQMQRDVSKIESKYANWMPQKPANQPNETATTAPKVKPEGGTTTPTDEKEQQKRLKAALEKEKALYQQSQAELKQLYASGQDEQLRTEEQYQARLLDLKEQYYRCIVELAGQGSKEAADAENQLGDIALERQKARAARLTQERERELEAEKQDYELRVQAFKQQLDNKQLTQEQHDIFVAAATSNHSDRVLSIEQKYYDRAEQMVKEGEGNMAAFVEQAKKRITEATRQSTQDRLEAEKTYLKNLETIKEMVNKADTSPKAREESRYQTQLLELEALYRASVDYAKRTGKETTEIENAYNQAKEELAKEHNRTLLELNEEKNRQLAQAIKDPLQQEMMNAYSAIDNLKGLIKDFSSFTKKEFKEKLVESIGQLVGSITSGLSSAFDSFKQIEMDNIEARYNAEIEAAAGDTEKIEQLEQEKAQKKLDVEKKYADVQFAIKASEIVASTAQAIMLCYAQLGPIAGSIMAGVMAATGAIQLAAANAEREKVKSQTLASSSSSGSGTGSRVATGRVTQHARGRYDVIGEEDNRLYEDVPYIGAAPTGIVRSPALISENGAELIVNADDLQRLRRHVNYPMVLQAINESRRPVPQHATGSYPVTSPAGTAAPPTAVADPSLSPKLIQRLAEAIETISNGIPASVSLTDLEQKQQLRDRSRKIGSKRG